MASSKKKRTTTKTGKTAPKKATPTPEVVKEVVAEAKVTVEQTAKSPFAKLYRWNKWLAIIHAFQALAILVVSDERLFPVTTTFLTPNPLADDKGLVVGVHHLFDVNAAWLIALSFLISAAAHTAMATFYRRRYEAELATGMNRLRWVEYSLGISTMMVTIGFLSGIYDLSSAIMLFVLSAIMGLCAMAMEVYNQGKKQPNWLVFCIGCVAGIVPWLVFSVYAIGAGVLGDGHVPTFVYRIYGTMFICSMGFAATMFLRYKGRGKWANYLYGEQTYMILTLVAKSVLAWQVFAGLLRP